MGEKKSVLVTFGGKNKVLSVPVVKEESDLGYLKREAHSLFRFDDLINTELTFHCFDPTWNDYIELDNDTKVSHKDKLKIIPVATKGLSISATLASPSGTSTPSTVLLCDSLSDEEVTPKCLPPPVKISRCIVSDESDNEMSQSCYTPVPLPHAVKKEKTSENPLPEPFPLLVNYRADVELCLKTGKMTTEAKRSFLSFVASKMFNYTKYPTSDEYTRVAIQIITKYPFLKPPNGSPTASIKQSLINRFKEFRRCPKSLSKSEGYFRNPKKKLVDELDRDNSEDLPPGEDDVSFQRHNKVLIQESKKANPNMVVVTQLMERTYTLRRKDILQNTCDVLTLFAKYPFLQNFEQLLLETQRITETENLREAVRDSWKKLWSPQIMKLALAEKYKNKRLKKILGLVDANEDLVLSSLVVLPYLLPDSRIKPDHEHVIWCLPENDNMEQAISEKRQSEPYILVVEDYSSPVQAFLVVDSQVVCETKIYH